MCWLELWLVDAPVIEVRILLFSLAGNLETAARVVDSGHPEARGTVH